MGKTEGLIDEGNALRRAQVRLSVLQAALGGSLHGGAPSDLVLSEDEQTGIFFIFQDIERDLSLAEEAFINKRR